jgi:hypothetical protein
MLSLLTHDPGPIAWLIVAFYFGAAALAFGARREAGDGRERRFWLCTALLLVLLGLNKQLDLQTFVTDAGRALARHEGWYAIRRPVQATFIVLLAAIAIACIFATWHWLRRSSAAVKAAVAGIVLLVAFVVIRAASFNHMDRWVTRTICGMRTGWWLELLALVVIGASAFAYGNTGRRRPL